MRGVLDMAPYSLLDACTATTTVVVVVTITIIGIGTAVGTIRRIGKRKRQFHSSTAAFEVLLHFLPTDRGTHTATGAATETSTSAFTSTRFG